MSQPKNDNQQQQHPMGNIWGWKFSVFSFFLIAGLAYVAFVIGEGPGLVKPVLTDTAAVEQEVPDTAITRQQIPDTLKNLLEGAKTPANKE